MRKPFDPAKFGTLHHAVGEEGVIRLQHRAWELRLAGVPRDVARRELAQQIDIERDAYFAKRYPHGVPDDAPYWGVILPAGGSPEGAGTDGGCSTGSVTTTQDSSRSWRLRSESYFYNVGGDGDWYSCSYALLQHRWRVIGVWMPWDGHKVERISAVQDGSYFDPNPPSGVPNSGSWNSRDVQYDSKSALASKFWDYIPELWSWTSSATATDVEFGTLSATSCLANW